MLDLVDTHCHIQSAGADRGERITREIWSQLDGFTGEQAVELAHAAGVNRLLCVCCDLEDSHQAIDFVQTFEQCWASVGIHPHEAKLYRGDNDKLNQFAELATKPKVVAVGECGLDYYRQHSPPADQAEVLKFQIELALKHNLPIIFHVREAFDDFWPIFDQYSGIRGVLHSYTDSLDNLNKALVSGLYIGVNGISTFTDKGHQLEVYRTIPLNRMLLETDSPFLTPKPHRGKVNQPKNLVKVAEFLADLRGESLAELSQTTTANARQLFNI